MRQWPVKGSLHTPCTDRRVALFSRCSRRDLSGGDNGLDEVRVVWYHPIEALIARREAIGAFCAFTVKRSEPGKVIYDWQGEVMEGSVPLKERYACSVPLLSSSGSIDDNWATWEVEGSIWPLLPASCVLDGLIWVCCGRISILMKLPGQRRISFRLQALISIPILRNNSRGNNQDNKDSQRMECGDIWILWAQCVHVKRGVRERQRAYNFGARVRVWARGMCFEWTRPCASGTHGPNHFIMSHVSESY